MARGGYGKGGGWGSMADRTRSAEPSDPAAPTAPTAPTIKHCWVSDRHGRLPGLLLGWRQVHGEWQGRVVRAAYFEGEGWLVVEDWLPAEFLEPG